MIVLDSCAAVEMVRKSERGMALRQLALQDEVIVSCDLIRAEASSVFRKLTRTNHREPSLANRYLSEAMALIDEFHSLESLQTEAFRESIRLNHSTYDLFYFVLARRLGATLFTTDLKLQKLCHEHGVDCVAELSLESAAKPCVSDGVPRS